MLQDTKPGTTDSSIRPLTLGLLLFVTALAVVVRLGQRLGIGERQCP